MGRPTMSALTTRDDVAEPHAGQAAARVARRPAAATPTTGGATADLPLSGAPTTPPTGRRAGRQPPAKCAFGPVAVASCAWLAGREASQMAPAQLYGFRCPSPAPGMRDLLPSRRERGPWPRGPRIGRYFFAAA
jgi:hypothetical protein